MLPAEAVRYGALLEREQQAALERIAGHWSRMTPDLDGSWEKIRPAVFAEVVTAQLAVAELAAEHTPNVIAATAPRASSAEYAVAAAAWQGVAGDGRSVATLTDGAVAHARQSMLSGLTLPQAVMAGGTWLAGAVATVLSDTHRGVEQMQAHSQGVARYVRMITGPSTCGRCIILAGRVYRTAEAFERHPQCDCVHIPASENVAGDLRTDPHAYLDSLDDKELARALGSKANAQAWQDGADANQLINAYRRRGDVRRAQMWGRDVSYTTEGMTRRGWAHKRMYEQHTAFRSGVDRKDRGTHTQVVRLMPSSIYELAKDRDDALRLLRTYGWIL